MGTTEHSLTFRLCYLAAIFLSLLVVVILDTRAYSGYELVAPVFASLAVACAQLLVFPSLEGQRRLSEALLALSFAAMASIQIIAYPRELTVLLRIAVTIAVTLLQAWVRAAVKYRGLRPLFRVYAVWHGLEDHARLVFSVSLLAVLPALMWVLLRPEASLVVALCSGAWLCFLAMICSLRVLSGRTLLIPVRREKLVLNTIVGKMRESDAPESLDSQMKALFLRIEAYMKEQKPYCDESFSIDYLTSVMASNRSYVSKTINIMSGRNFRQYVNFHRVLYAQELLKERKMPVADISNTVGFHSQSTFNLAFKIATDLTPREWQEKNEVVVLSRQSATCSQGE